MRPIILAALAVALSAAPAAAGGPRVEVPITRTVLSDGTVRYSVPVSIGRGAPIEAMLDTGSFGLRVLSPALSSDDYQATETERRYPFGGGALFEGPIAEATVAIGGLATAKPVGIQVVRNVGCTERQPGCPAGKLGLDQYGIGGKGFAGEGFKAILGTSLRRAPVDVAADNPLPELVDSSWLVELPRPEETGPGRLVLNPSPEEVAGFTTFKLSRQDEGGGWVDTRLPGCIAENGGKPFCAPTLLDTGDDEVVLTKPDAARRSEAGRGTRAQITLKHAGSELSMRFVAGEGPATHLSSMPPSGPVSSRIQAGVLPFYSYSVLYNVRQGTIGLKARPPVGR